MKLGEYFFNCFYDFQEKILHLGNTSSLNVCKSKHQEKDHKHIFSKNNI